MGGCSAAAQRAAALLASALPAPCSPTLPTCWLRGRAPLALAAAWVGRRLGFACAANEPFREVRTVLGSGCSARASGRPQEEQQRCRHEQLSERAQRRHGRVRCKPLCMLSCSPTRFAEQRAWLEMNKRQRSCNRRGRRLDATVQMGQRHSGRQSAAGPLRSKAGQLGRPMLSPAAAPLPAGWPPGCARGGWG